MTAKTEADAWFTMEVLPLESALSAYLRGNCRDRSEAADLLQEVYARAYASCCRKKPDNTRRFVYTIAKNLLIDRSRRAQILSIDSVGDIDELQIPSSSPSPEALLDSRMELSLLSSAIDTMPDKCREVFTLSKIEGKSQAEIAKRLGISKGTVEKHVSKGVRLIAAALYGAGQPYELKVAERGKVARLLSLEGRKR